MDILRRFNKNHQGYVLFINDGAITSVTCCEFRGGEERTLIPEYLVGEKDKRGKKTVLATFVDYELIYNAGAIVVFGSDRDYTTFDEMSRHASLLARSEGIKILYQRGGKSEDTLIGMIKDRVKTSDDGPKITTTVVCDQEKNTGEVYIAKK